MIIFFIIGILFFFIELNFFKKTQKVYSNNKREDTVTKGSEAVTLFIINSIPFINIIIFFVFLVWVYINMISFPYNFYYSTSHAFRSKGKIYKKLEDLLNSEI